MLVRYLREVREFGVGVTVHVAEVCMITFYSFFVLFTVVNDASDGYEYS
jgi:hypothetical protein